MEELIKSESDEVPVAEAKEAPEAESEEFSDTETEPEEEPATPVTASRTLNADHVETHRTRPPLLRLLAGILAILIIAALLVLGARWIYHKTHHTVKPAPANTKSLPRIPAGSTNKTSPSSPQTAGSTSKSSPAAGTKTPITNTGPGDVVAIFVGAGLAAAGLHYVWSLRRSVQS
jgi:hypothetical protein